MRMWPYYMWPDTGPCGRLFRILFCRPLTFVQCFVSLKWDVIVGGVCVCVWGGGEGVGAGEM
jgi:hypothetical protein